MTVTSATSSSEPADAPVGSPPSAYGPGTNPAIDLPGEAIRRAMAVACRSAGDKRQLVQGIGGLLVRCGCRALQVISRSPDGATWAAPVSLIAETTAITEHVRGEIDAACALWLKSPGEARLVSHQLEKMPSSLLLVAPVFAGSEITDALVVIAPRAASSGGSIDWIVALAAREWSLWQSSRLIDSRNGQLLTLDALVRLTGQLQRTSSRLETAVVTVNESRRLAGCQQAALLLRDGGFSASEKTAAASESAGGGSLNTDPALFSVGAFRLAALSDVEHFDRQSTATQTIESMAAGLDSAPAFWIREEKKEQPAAFRSYCEQFAVNAVAMLPLKQQDGQLLGWLICGFTHSQELHVGRQQQLAPLAEMLGGTLDVVLRNQRSLMRVAWDRARSALRHRRARVAGVVLAILALSMCIPWTYQIPCQCRLQLTSRRFVAAPFEGLLEKTLVESGEVVEEGQILARMDARQLRMELDSRSAELDSERKKRDAALARGNVADSQIAASSISSLESEIAILQTRLEHTDIRSPLAGVIVSGDLDNAEGVPLTLGQHLFEVGPLETMQVEVLVPEREIRFAEPGMPIDVEFSAFPFRTFRGTLQRIHPRAELIDDASVFVAEFEIDNPQGELRPGMIGRAKIRSHRHMLGWNLFHHALDDARRWLVW